MTTPSRTVRAALLAIAALAACASTASAAGKQYDANYGTKLLPSIAGARQITATKCEAIGNDTFAITGQVGAGPAGGRPLTRQRQVTTIAIAKSNGSTNRSWLKLPSKVGEELLGSDWSTGGDFTYVYGPTRDRKIRKFVVSKTNYITRKNGGWPDVTITLPKPKSSTVADVNVLNLRDGGVLVVIDRGDLEWIYRFTSTGKPANFGTNGVVKLDRLGPSSWYLPPRATTPLLETYDGSLIVAASGRPGQPASGEAIGLIKLSASGALVDGFADHGLWIPPTSLAEEKPLSEGTKRDAPQTLSVVGGRAAGEPLTVLFGTKHSNDIGSGTLVAATQLSEKGVRSAITKSFDQSGDGGDGGFPDALPFSFVPTAKGFSYASAWTQTGGGNTTYTYGAIGGLSPTFAPPLTPKRFNTKSKFLANDFAATPDGKHVYACGAIAQSRANRPWAKFAPALKRFDL